MARLLEGLRVLELSIYGFVPSAAAILGDWGAQVIKVEHPEQGDPIRNITAYGFSPQDGDVGGGAMWEVLNRGKRSRVRSSGDRRVATRKRLAQLPVQARQHPLHVGFPGTLVPRPA